MPALFNEEAWDVDGASLHTHAYAITTWGGSRGGVPPLRGTNAQYAYVPGEIWLPKLPGPRPMGLSMFLTGADPATGRVPAETKRQYNTSLEYLQRLFWHPGRQFSLGKRWLRSDPVTGNPVLGYAQAQAELVGDMIPTNQMRTRSSFTVDLMLADPFFYGPVITSTSMGVNGYANVTNAGAYAVFAQGSDLQIDFIGPLSAPTLINTSVSPNVTCGIAGTVAAGETLTLLVSDFVAQSHKGSTLGYRNGEVVNSGTHPWMALQTGLNRLHLTGSGTGHALVRHRAPYL